MITTIAKRIIPRVFHPAVKDARDCYRLRVTELYPWAFDLSHLRTQHTNLLVTPETDILITGYPRSGNGYALYSFLQMQTHEQQLKVAHHIHLISEIRRARGWKVPVLALIRNPLESVSSLRLRENVPLDAGLIRYRIYYQQLLRMKSQIVISSFETTTKRPDKFVDSLNSRFGCGFQSRPLTSDDDQAIKEKISSASNSRGEDFTKVSVPNAEKKKLSEQHQDELLHSRSHQRSLSHCQKLFDAVSKFAV